MLAEHQSANSPAMLGAASLFSRKSTIEQEPQPAMLEPEMDSKADWESD